MIVNYNVQLTDPNLFIYSSDIQDDMSDDLSPSPQIAYDRLLGGLLVEGFD